MDNIKDIIPQVIQQLSLRKADDKGKLQRIWQTLFHGKVAEHTALDQLTDDHLVVLVDSPAWLFQLNLQKAKILETLKEEIPNIKNIVFKIGKTK